MSTRLVRVRGKVQGVWYRAWTVEQASRRGLAGWVRNRSDGSVEALFAGDDAAVDAMIAACRRGPRLAKVEEVVSEPSSEPAPVGFEERPTI